MCVSSRDHACLVYMTPRRHTVKVILPVTGNGKSQKARKEEVVYLNFLADVLDTPPTAEFRKLLLESIRDTVKFRHK